MNKLLFMIFAAFAILSFACDDKYKEQTNTPVCTRTCNASEDCKCEIIEGKETCACKAKAVDDPKPCGVNKNDTPACDPACTEDNDCACRDGAWTCVHVDVIDKCDPKCPDDKKCECTMEACACVPVTPVPTCDPACDEATQDCVCEEDKCECKTKDAPVEDCFCDDTKTVKCPDNNKEKCELPNE